MKDRQKMTEQEWLNHSSPGKFVDFSKARPKTGSQYSPSPEKETQKNSNEQMCDGVAGKDLLKMEGMMSINDLSDVHLNQSKAFDRNSNNTFNSLN